MSYSLIIGLLGSFTIRYFPSFWAITRSRTHLTIPQALSMLRLICWPNSIGLNFCVPRMTCLELSLTLYLVTYPNLRLSAPARMLCTVHLANLQALFFNSLASTAPLWVSSFCLQSTPPLCLESHSFRAFKFTNCVSLFDPTCTASSSHLQISTKSFPKFHLRYL